MSNRRPLTLSLMVATVGLSFTHRAATTTWAFPPKVVIEGRVVDESDKGVPEVAVTLWRVGKGVVDTRRTGPDGRYHFELDPGATVDVSYVHSLLGSASVNQLSGFENHRIGPVIFGDPTKTSAVSAHAELQSIDRLILLAMINPQRTPPQVKEFLRGENLLNRVKALGKTPEPTDVESDGTVCAQTARFTEHLLSNYRRRN